MAHSRSGVLRDLRTLFGPGTGTRLSDAQLLGRFVACEADASAAAEAAEAAFAALVARHGPMVLGVCRRALTDPNDVEDAFQATFLVLVGRAPTIQVGDSLGGWLHGVARRVAARVRARHADRRRRTASIASCPEPDVAGADPALAELLAALDEEIGRLPAKYRNPLVMCHLEGLSHAEAASRLGWPIGTVSGRLSLARKRLRQLLARRGFGLAVVPLSALLDPGAARAAPPEALANATCRAAMYLARGGAAATGILPAVALDLARLVLGEMVAGKLKTAAAVLAVVGTLALGVGSLARSEGEDPRDRPHDVAGSKGAGLAQVAPADASNTAGTTSLHFPADRAIGILSTRPRDARDWPGGDWERLGEAIGDIVLPAGRQVRLELGAGGRADLSPLRRLRPDDLRSLRLRDADLRGDALASIAHLTGLEEVQLFHCPVGDDGARHLARLTRLRYLSIGGCQVGDAGLARLASLEDLEHLDLSGDWLTRTGLAHVGRMKSLRSLHLYRCAIEDDDLAELAALPALESLRLADCLHITDAGLAHLGTLSRLKNLDLESTQTTDAGLAHLAKLKSLEDLNLPDTRITEAGLAHLRGLRSLRRLSLPQWMTDAGLAHLGAITSLRNLTIRAGFITDRGIAALDTLVQLQELNLGSGASRDHAITDAAAGHLAQLPALKKLWLQHTLIGDDGLEALSRSRSLESLLMNGNRVTAEGLRHLSNLPRLTYLSLSGIQGPTAGLRHLGRLKGLTGLKVDGSGLLDGPGGDPAGADGRFDFLAGLTRLKSLTLGLPVDDAGMRKLSGLTALTWLEIEDKGNRLTDDGLASVGLLKDLANLHVSGLITDASLGHLEGLRKLYYARLGCRVGAISDGAVATLKARNPSIQVMHYTRAQKAATPPAVGRPAPALEVETFDGQKVRLEEWKGKVVLLHFWATWCTPCLAETPRLKQFIDERRDPDRSFEALSLSLDEDPHWARRHAERNALGWPQAWLGAKSPAGLAYAVDSVPHYVVIDRDGKLVYSGSDLGAAGNAVDGILPRRLP